MFLFYNNIVERRRTDMKKALKKPSKESQKLTLHVTLFGGSKKDECKENNCFKC